MYISRENEKLYLRPLDFNVCRIMTQLAEIVKNNGGKVKPIENAQHKLLLFVMKSPIISKLIKIRFSRSTTLKRLLEMGNIQKTLVLMNLPKNGCLIAFSSQKYQTQLLNRRHKLFLKSLQKHDFL